MKLFKVLVVALTLSITGCNLDLSEDQQASSTTPKAPQNADEARSASGVFILLDENGEPEKKYVRIGNGMIERCVYVNSDWACTSSASIQSFADPRTICFGSDSLRLFGYDSLGTQICTSSSETKAEYYQDHRVIPANTLFEKHTTVISRNVQTWYQPVAFHTSESLDQATAK